jgi:hypothetical protein
VVGDRLLQLVAVVLLGITTIGTAWCGFQAARWNGQSGDLNGVASERRVEASRLFGLATQKITYDSMVVAKYAEATQEGNDQLLQFYRKSVVRPPFLPVLDRWEAGLKAGDPTVGVFEDEEYLAEQFAAYEETVAAAEQATRESQEASEAADAYVGTTILLAMALFFAGVESSFQFRFARLLLLMLATGAVAVAASRIVDLPVIWAGL